MSEIRSFAFGNKGTLIQMRHSCYETKSPNESDPPSKSGTYSTSDINILRTTDFPSVIDSGRVNRRRISVTESSSDDYYKNYEHDEVPVRDSSSLNNDVVENVMHSGSKELTNSDLAKIETRVYKNAPKDIQDMESPVDQQENNIKLFKTTVLEILEKFYGNMQDFEIYKKKFQDILSKNKENIVDEMEQFVKEMIQNIVSSESCMTSETNGRNNYSSNEAVTEDTFADGSKTFSLDTGDIYISTRKTVEEYKNENYLTDSTFEDENCKINQSENETCTIYMIKGKPCVEIKIAGRNMLSEFNIRNRDSEKVDQIASADNVKSVAAKRLQMTKYMKQVERESSDNIIPVKNSYAKKDIHSEDYPEESGDNNKSFISKICNFLCKKLRKTSFG